MTLSDQLNQAKTQHAALGKTITDLEARLKAEQEKEIKVGDYVVGLVDRVSGTSSLTAGKTYRVFNTRECHASHGGIIIYLEAVAGGWCRIWEGVTLYRKAQPDEVRAHLLKETEEKGFKVGVPIADRLSNRSFISSIHVWLPGDSEPENPSEWVCDEVRKGVPFVWARYAGCSAPVWRLKIWKQDDIKLSESLKATVSPAGVAMLHFGAVSSFNISLDQAIKLGQLAAKMKGQP